MVVWLASYVAMWLACNVAAYVAGCSWVAAYAVGELVAGLAIGNVAGYVAG